MASGVFRQGALTDPALADRKPLWQYAEKLDDTYCAGCHAPIAADHYTVNAWPSIAKGMGARTSMSENELDILRGISSTTPKILPRNSDPRRSGRKL
ncbi:hypothetical protein ACLB1M_15265 [Escherichia coli]